MQMYLPRALNWNSAESDGQESISIQSYGWFYIATWYKWIAHQAQKAVHIPSTSPLASLRAPPNCSASVVGRSQLLRRCVRWNPNRTPYATPPRWSASATVDLQAQRFFGIFSPPGDSSSDGVGVELDEDEVLWMKAAPESTDIALHETSTGSHQAVLFPSPSAAFHRPGDRSFGILGVLSEGDANGFPGSNGGVAAPSGQILHRKTSISSTSSSLDSNSTSSSSASTAARMIPSAPKTKPEEYSSSMAAAGQVHQAQSAPVNVPVAVRRSRGVEDVRDVDDDDDKEDEMHPPHEIVARNYARSQTATFSVLEGAGRTLKGRDLRRVRNAVLRQTGFLD